MSWRTFRHYTIYFLLALATSTLMSGAQGAGLLRPVTLQSSDLLFRLKPDRTARWSVLAAIDDRSVAELRSYGRTFYWPRRFHAQAIDNLKAAGARIIVFDVLFDAPADGDDELERALREAGNVVLAEPPDSGTALPPAPGQLYRWGAAIEPLERLRNAAAGVGHAYVSPDTDGAIRSTPLVINVGGEDLGTLPLVAAAKFLRRPEVLEAPVRDRHLPFAGREIPLDDQGRMWISYLGDTFKTTEPPTFPSISYVDVINNRFPPELVRGKLVFVGSTAVGYADDYWTPVSRMSKMDGVEIHANSFETIMSPRDFVAPAPTALTIMLIFAAGGLAFLAGGFLAPWAAAIVLTLVAAAYLAASVVLVDAASMLMDLPFPLLTMALALLAILMFRVVIEQAQQRALKGALSQYLSPDLMEEVVRDPGAIKLGGEKREMTVLFSDIRGFTSLSETLEPERLVHILNIYLTRMSDVIFKHQGTVDKYMGDAIMAFWGAPRSQPDHARMGCVTALEMVHELEKLNEEFRREGISTLHMGIGLNTGPMAVGNMGSERRFDYTVMGDSVNLGSRLEGLNKEYGTSIIVADSTLGQAGDGFSSRFVDLVAVKGKREPVSVYELLPTTNGDDPERKGLLEAYSAGVQQYRERHFSAALGYFDRALTFDPDDGPSRLYRERTLELLEDPPPVDWDGVFVMAHK